VTSKLVILGAGIGGLSVVAALAESGTSSDDVDITLVDNDFTHFLGFTLPWVMRGWRDAESVPIRPGGAALAGIRSVSGTVSTVDPVGRRVHLAGGTELSFDALVIATGARNTPDKVPGLRDAVDRGRAVHYYSAEDAAKAHRALQAFRGGKLSFLVASQPYRCPVAPYEGALLAADLLTDKGLRESTEISVYSPEQHPMPSAGPYAGLELVEMLRHRGIEFFGEHAVAHLDAAFNEIHFENGTVVQFDLLVFVPPHEPAVTLDGPGWITVDARTMQTRYPGIFAIGDTTVVTSPSGRPLPKAAIFARNGARAAAANVLRFLGMADAEATLSGEGYCYVDTGGRESALGQGDFFTTPHPAIHLSQPSSDLHRDKQREERQWRTTWEVDTRL